MSMGHHTWPYVTYSGGAAVFVIVWLPLVYIGCAFALLFL